jgi:hypothetical protein
VAGLPPWVLLAPAAILWLLAVLDVATDRRVGPDRKLLWFVAMFLAPPLAPVRFLVRRRVAERPVRPRHPERDAYVLAVEAAGGRTRSQPEAGTADGLRPGDGAPDRIG